MQELSVAEKMASMIPDLNYVEMKVLADLLISHMMRCEDNRRASIEKVLRERLQESLNASQC